MTELQYSATPRVNGELLPKFVNRTVNLVGRILSCDQGRVELQTSDQRRITVILAIPSPFPVDSIVEVIGTVNNDLSIREEGMIQYTETFHFQNYDAVVNLTHKYHELFY
jgi:replication factor A3